ncbi:MAG: ethanolamine ammonia-lyase subunit EutB [Proteobacteria bacterium]|nr:ethanolamine ammonia-lyase subunit EutB [Pseudomonadota bacterium]
MNCTSGQLGRRSFLAILARGTAVSALLVQLPFLAGCAEQAVPPMGVRVGDISPGEDLFAYIRRIKRSFDPTLYRQLVGAANAFKEGDEIIGVAAADPGSRTRARALLANTVIGDLNAQPLYSDALYRLLTADLDSAARARTSDWTLQRLKDFLLSAGEPEIKGIMGGLSSDVIACVVKLMSNDELIVIGRKVFNPLPGSQIGARGYMGARIQPNSPTDNPEDIRWQVFNGWAFAVGDVLLGNNPVSSAPDSVLAIEETLKDIIDTFGLGGALPHCVLSHIDIQSEVETGHPGVTALWFQSLAGTVAANQTFDVTIEKMRGYAASRTGAYGLYFETGQGADATNGHAAGFDMVAHESRKYGFARMLKQDVETARAGAGQPAAAWVHVNDVAGFIGPEVFRSREQLVRCCLEDIVMGKLHGIMIGLDICSTLHMDVTLDDLDWCIEQIMPANPGYLMALPTKNDPMLSYLTTAFQDHLKVRAQFGYKVNDVMWKFFQSLGVIDANGDPGENFGDPSRVYLAYRRAKADLRPDREILAEAKAQISAVRGRGVFIAEGHGAKPWDLEPGLDKEVHRLYEDAKVSLHTEWDSGYVAGIGNVLLLATRSADRDDYILHPVTGEQLSDAALATVRDLRRTYQGNWNVQVVISDGLNVRALMDEGHLTPFLDALRHELSDAGYRVAPKNIVLTTGRVRAGYRLGEALFNDGDTASRGIIHIIGERPGSGHHNFSAYITGAPGAVWARPGTVDHNISRVVSGISNTALLPIKAAAETVNILGSLMPPG